MHSNNTLKCMDMNGVIKGALIAIPNNIRMVYRKTKIAIRPQQTLNGYLLFQLYATRDKSFVFFYTFHFFSYIHCITFHCFHIEASVWYESNGTFQFHIFFSSFCSFTYPAAFKSQFIVMNKNHFETWTPFQVWFLIYKKKLLSQKCSYSLWLGTFGALDSSEWKLLHGIWIRVWMNVFLCVCRWTQREIREWTVAFINNRYLNSTPL